MQKKHGEIAHICGKTLMQNVVEQNEPDQSTIYLNTCLVSQSFQLPPSSAYQAQGRPPSTTLPQGTPWDSQIDAIVCGLIHETTIELGQDVKQFEKDMKRSVMNKQQQQNDGGNDKNQRGLECLLTVVKNNV